MRYIDFMVYYYMENFKSKHLGSLLWNSQLGRAVFLASLNLSLLLLILVEIFCYGILKIDISNSSYFGVGLAIVGFLNAQLFDRIYINKKRYEYIVSTEYKPFKLSVALGVFISLLFTLLFMLGAVGTALLIGNSIKK